MNVKEIILAIIGGLFITACVVVWQFVFNQSLVAAFG